MSDHTKSLPFMQRLFNKILMIWLERKLLLIDQFVVLQVQAMFVDLAASQVSLG